MDSNVDQTGSFVGIALRKARSLELMQKHHYAKDRDDTVDVPNRVNRIPHNRRTSEGMRDVNRAATKYMTAQQRHNADGLTLNEKYPNGERVQHDRRVQFKANGHRVSFVVHRLKHH